MGIIPDLTGVMSLLWDDEMDIYRNEDVIDGNMRYPQEVKKYTAEPCKLSKPGKAGYGDEDPESDNTTEYDMLLICNPNTDIKFGDRIIHRKFGNKAFEQTLEIGDPDSGRYVNSLQIPCRVIKSA